MVLVSCAVLPHGAMILDPAKPDLPAGAADLHGWCVRAAEDIAQSDPEVIILFTPHGNSLTDSVNIYLNDSVTGSAEWEGNWADYKVNRLCDSAMATRLLRQFTEEGIKADGTISFAKSVPAPLRWGEVVPLWFLDTLMPRDCKVVIVCWPQTRFDPEKYAEVFVQVGRSLRAFCGAELSRISVVFSCDLSHVHGNPPNTSRLYCCDEQVLGCNKSIAAAFDSAVVHWAETICGGDTHLSKQILMNECLSNSVPAKSCGWAGLCGLQGLSEGCVGHDFSSCCTGSVHGYVAPTYYGMIVISLQVL
jgi:aromatic ring-opening dioxygenase LigB subunit